MTSLACVSIDAVRKLTASYVSCPLVEPFFWKTPDGLARPFRQNGTGGVSKRFPEQASCSTLPSPGLLLKEAPSSDEKAKLVLEGK